MTQPSNDDLCRRLCAAPEAPGAALSVVLVAAHPDDEVVGAGARLPAWPGVLLVHVTDGSPKDLRDARAHGFSTRADYARARRGELLRALALAGVGPDQARALDVTDQEAALHLEAITRDLAGLLRDRRPDVVVTHPYEGGHPDHDAAAFAVHAACALLRAEGGAPPAVVEMTSYHRRLSREPAPPGAAVPGEAFAATPSGADLLGGPPADMEIGEFLPAAGAAVVTRDLSSEERRFKRALFDCFVTQADVLRAFPLDRERFRPAPSYDFCAPPHEGPLFYETRPWGMTGARFRSLAEAAQRALGLRGPL